jgi:hypothetical protein
MTTATAMAMMNAGDWQWEELVVKLASLRSCIHKKVALIRVQWSSGYDFCLTHRRSPVRSRIEPAFFLSCTCYSLALIGSCAPGPAITRTPTYSFGHYAACVWTCERGNDISIFEPIKFIFFNFGCNQTCFVPMAV